MPAQAVPTTEFAPARRYNRSSPHPLSAPRLRPAPPSMGRGRRSAGDWGVLYPVPRTVPAVHADRVLQWWQVNAVKAGVIVASAWCVMANARPLWETAMALFR